MCSNCVLFIKSHTHARVQRFQSFPPPQSQGSFFFRAEHSIFSTLFQQQSTDCGARVFGERVGWVGGGYVEEPDQVRYLVHLRASNALLMSLACARGGPAEKGNLAYKCNSNNKD